MAGQRAGRIGTSATPVHDRLTVCIGKAGTAVGDLAYAKDGTREYSSFAYRESWLTDRTAFNISPDLGFRIGHQQRKAPSKDESPFFLALADTEPDAWGRRVIARAHAKSRQDDPMSPQRALHALDYLRAVDDFSRIGALRLQSNDGSYLKTVVDGKRATPAIIDLEPMYTASRAVETNTESAQDLRYLQGKGTSLGGMRPKCTLIDEGGGLAIGKFPSVSDERSVTRGEVLAMHLAGLSGVDVPNSRVVTVQGTPITVIARFDRTKDHARLPYISAASLLQAGRHEDRAYTEVVDQMRAFCQNPAQDAQSLWRRLVFNLLITNVDDHLHNLGFLHVAHGHWRLAPAFDLNPFPDKERESKTWLTEDTGPVRNLQMLLDEAARFHVDGPLARTIVGQVYGAIARWREVAASPAVGMTSNDCAVFAGAFEHAEFAAAGRWMGLD